MFYRHAINLQRTYYNKYIFIYKRQCVEYSYFIHSAAKNVVNSF